MDEALAGSKQWTMDEARQTDAYLITRRRRRRGTTSDRDEHLVATDLQTTAIWEEGRGDLQTTDSFTCRAGKGKKKRDRALPSESARWIAASAAHDFAKRVNLPNVFAKLLEMHFCHFCQFFKDAKCFLPNVGDAPVEIRVDKISLST